MSIMPCDKAIPVYGAVFRSPSSIFHNKEKKGVNAYVDLSGGLG